MMKKTSDLTSVGRVDVDVPDSSTHVYGRDSKFNMRHQPSYFETRYNHRVMHGIAIMMRRDITQAQKKLLRTITIRLRHQRQ